jgi:hypothetical protein
MLTKQRVCLHYGPYLAYLCQMSDSHAELRVQGLRPAALLVSKIRHVKCSEMHLNTNRNHSQQKPLGRREVQLYIFKGRLTKIEKLKDIKHENSRKLARNTQERRIVSVKCTCYSLFFMHECGSRKSSE